MVAGAECLVLELQQFVLRETGKDLTIGPRPLPDGKNAEDGPDCLLGFGTRKLSETGLGELVNRLLVPCLNHAGTSGFVPIPRANSIVATIA